MSATEQLIAPLELNDAEIPPAPEVLEQDPNFSPLECAATAWRSQNLGAGSCDGNYAAEVLGATDLHLVFQWDEDLCLLCSRL
jgi:hypothetical protein